jgi:polyisoprenoid-binding protein YceI
MVTIPPGTYVIDPAHSEVSFTVRHAGVAKVRGTFTEFSGQVDVAEDLRASRASVEIAASSVDTGDSTRDTHLRSSDFFAAQERPTWTFVSNEVRESGDDLVLAGELTINGVTRPVELDVEYNGTAVDPWGNPRIGFSGATEVNRKDYGLTWNVALEAGGVLVSNKAKIAIEVSAVKQA